MNEWMQDYRRRHLDRLLELAMPDAVYALVDYNQSNTGTPMQIDLQELAALGLLEHLQEWERRCHQLRDHACAAWYDVQTKPNPDISDLVSRLASENPGFDESSYRKAIDYGMMALR